MISLGLTILMTGFWLSESRPRTETAWTSRETLASLLQETLDLAWQTAVLTGSSWAMQAAALHLPQAESLRLALVLVLAYALSFLRPRPESSRTLYFLALTLMTWSLQASAWTAWPQAVQTLGTVVGGSAACRLLLLGLQERLRWARIPERVQGIPLALFCAALLALILWSMGF